jgi:long-chain acyl-CoA synthetase
MEIFLYGVGGQIGYSTGDALRLLDDIATLRPTFLPAVPRLLNRIYARVYAATAEAPGLAGVLARKGLSVKLANLEAGFGNKHALWDRLLFNKVRMVLGGRVDKVLTGSAPVAAEVLSFIRVAFIVDIAEAYGMTENSASATSTQPGELEASHVGPPSPNGEIKLVDVAELNYFSTDKPYPRGEICTRGPATFSGYLKDEKKTKEAIDEEGWLHTGDIGFIKENGALTIIDRVKNVFKVSVTWNGRQFLLAGCFLLLRKEL